MNSFIFFGCWNNVDCKESDKTEYIIRDLVLKLVKKDVKYNKKVVYLAGDNWYSNKVEINSEDLAYYLLEVLKSGYDKIYDLKTELHICAGNHDVKYDSIEHETKEIKDLKSNCMIKTQKKYIEELNKLLLNKSQLSESFVVDTLNSGNFDIFIEDFSKLLLKTNSSSSHGLLENFHPTLEELSHYDGKDILPDNSNIINIYVDNIGIVEKDNYVMIIINTNILDDDKYIDKVINVLKENYGNKKKFVMGHIPYYYLKNNEIKKNEELINALFQSMADNNFIYLCADSHVFSIMIILLNGVKLVQITVGTGGASPDINAQNVENLIEIVHETASIKYYLINAYGYSIISLYDKYIKVIYKNINKNEDGPVLTEYVYKIGTSDNDGEFQFGKVIYVVKSTKQKKIEYGASLAKNKKTLCDKIKTAIKNIKEKSDNEFKHVVKSEKKDVYCYIKRKKTDKNSKAIKDTTSLSSVAHSLSPKSPAK